MQDATETANGRVPKLWRLAFEAPELPEPPEPEPPRKPRGKHRWDPSELRRVRRRETSFEDLCQQLLRMSI
jgi:hypothetical protein